MLLATGATKPFDPTAKAPGRDLEGVHFAMDFLTRNTKSLLDSKLGDKAYLSAEGLDVVVIGGGDTGADCIGTSLRHGATSIVNLEVVPHRPRSDARATRGRSGRRSTGRLLPRRDDRQGGRRPAPVPDAHQGVRRRGRQADRREDVEIDWSKPVEGGAPFTEVPGSEKVWPADLCVLSTGFVGPELSLVEMLGLETQAPRGNWKTIAAEHGELDAPDAYPNTPTDHAAPLDRSWLVLLHLSQFCGYMVPLAGFVAPVIIWLVMKDSDDEYDRHGRAVVNWIISSVIWWVVTVLLCLAIVGFPLAFVLGALCVIFPIVGAVKASQGVLWKYPMTIPFL